ncbi:taurine catabolism dioxygenase [Powellomyces hirtus]|nr:taurine catabolism dioxygenase [Powellomyces hirtus]
MTNDPPVELNSFPRRSVKEDDMFDSTKMNLLAGQKADPDKRSLLEAVTKRIDLSPIIGTELHGLQLSQLSEQQKEDLALFVSERGVVFFRDQDITLEQQQELGRSWGRVRFMCIQSGAKATPEKTPSFFTLLKRMPCAIEQNSQHTLSTLSTLNFRSKIHAGEGWHTDISFEKVPSSCAILKVVEVPPYGGDTIWASTYAAYDKLSPALREVIESLTALHNADQFLSAREDPTGQTFLRRDTVAFSIEHPVVRTHPITGWKILYVNKAFTKHIKGFTKAESGKHLRCLIDMLLNFLTDHIATSDDVKVRFRWEKNSVAIWDNRATQHLALWDYYPHNRQAQRVLVLGERPYRDPESKSQLEAGGALYQAPPLWLRDVDGAGSGYRWSL